MALHLNSISDWGKIGRTVSFDGSNPLEREGLFCFLLIFSFLPPHILIREKNQLQIMSFLLIRSLLPFHPDLVAQNWNVHEQVLHLRLGFRRTSNCSQLAQLKVLTQEGL